MSQSTTKPESTGDRAVLFQCSDELAEFAALFSELAMPFEEYVGDIPDPSELEGARLAVVSGRRLIEGGAQNLGGWPRTIAVVDDSSKTLVTHLSRMGVAMVIRRPIHPHALRLLLLHEIYRGPERRVRKRILIGHSIRVVSGLFRPRALLLELSPTGARLELAHAPKIGSKIRVLLGKDLTKGKPVKLHAKVVRCIRPSNKKDRTEAEIGVVLLDAQVHARTIKTILDRFALGPAKWYSKDAAAPTEPTAPTELPQEAPARRLPPSRAPEASTARAPEDRIGVETSISSEVEVENSVSAETVEESTVEGSRDRNVVYLGSEPTPLDEPESVESEGDENADIEDETELLAEDPSERRSGTRIPYDKRVVALGEEAARVLVGRDLSEGGMRIEQTPVVRVGDRLRVALHSGTQTEPLVVIANALRDDGDDGLVLTFEELSPNQTARLAEIMGDETAMHATADELEADDTDEIVLSESIIVAEMLETIPPESDAEIDAHLDSVFDTSESV